MVVSRRLAAASLAVGLAVSSPLRAQTVVDEGRFTITNKAGDRVGTETFSIVRVVAGGPYTAKATLRMGNREVRTGLETDAAGSPTRFSHRQFVDGAQTDSLFATRVANVLTSVSIGQGGVRVTREILVNPNSIVLDDELVHPLYFAVLAAPSAVPFAMPLTGIRGMLAPAAKGPDGVTLGDGTQVSTTRWEVGSGPQRRELWLDPQGRLMQVSDPGKSLLATRDQLPRG